MRMAYAQYAHLNVKADGPVAGAAVNGGSEKKPQVRSLLNSRILKLIVITSEFIQQPVTTFKNEERFLDTEQVRP